MNENSKIAINSIIIFARLIIISLLGLITSRIVLDALGVSDYGLFNVVGGIVILLNVVNSSMMATTYRYIAFGIGKDDDLNKIVNATIAIHVIFAILIISIGLPIGEFYINNYLNVAEGKLQDAKFIFHVSILAAALSTLLVPFQGMLVAYEKFSVNAIIDICSNLLKFTAVCFLIYSDGNRLRIYSYIMLGYTVVSSLLYYLYCLKNYSTIIKFKLSKDLKLYREMISFALWTLFGALASVGKVQVSAILINFFFGTIVNAAFAVANQVQSFIVMFAQGLNNAAIPQITKNYSGGNAERSLKLTSYISKYTFFLMCIVAFPVILEMDFLLGLWLKEVPEGTVIFCKLIILGELLNCLGAGIPALVNATGNIRTYQLILHSFTLLGLPISFSFFKLGFHPYTISIVFCFIIGLSAVLRLYLLKNIFNFNVKIFIKTSYLRMLYISVPLVLVYIFYKPQYFLFWEHILGIVLSEFVLIVTVLLLGLDRTEKIKMQSLLSIFKLKYL